MRATITKIDPPRTGTDNVTYIAVYFKTQHGTSAKTHLCPAHDNFQRWRDFLEVGVVLTNLNILSDEKIIDADSYPVVVVPPSPKQSELF